MTNIEKSQNLYARIAGFMFLFALFGAVFGNFLVRSRLYVSGDATETANNIVAHERLFRIGIAVELATCAGVVILAVALYTLLKPVNRGLALLALMWWVGEAAILGVVLFSSFAVLLLLLSGDAYLAVFEPDQLHALATFFSKMYYYTYDIALAFFACGSAVFSYLLLTSRYVPRILAGWGIFASLSALIGIFIMMIFPDTIAALGILSTVPIGIYELILGIWLLVFGIKTQARIGN